MKVKAKINQYLRRPQYDEGEIYWMSFGENVGFEEDGKGPRFVRPGLVVARISRELCWTVPLTTQTKTGRHYFRLSGLIGGRTATVILSQMRVLDVTRIAGGKRLGRVARNELVVIKSRLSAYLLG